MYLTLTISSVFVYTHPIFLSLSLSLTHLCHRLVLVYLLQQCLGVVGGVVLHDLGWVAIIDLHDELRELAANSLVELLQELQTSRLDE